MAVIIAVLSLGSICGFILVISMIVARVKESEKRSDVFIVKEGDSNVFVENSV